MSGLADSNSRVQSRVCGATLVIITWKAHAEKACADSNDFEGPLSYIRSGINSREPLT
jgi:hypothetical protein